MKIVFSEKDLKNFKFKLKIIGGYLNIKGYSTEQLKGNLCPDCLLKSFKKSDIIDTTNLDFPEGCMCDFSYSPNIDLKIDTHKNSQIIIA